MISAFIIIILSIVSIYLFFNLLYLKIFKKYTRERFAFVGLALLSEVLFTILVQVYSAQGYINAAVNTSNFVLHTNLTNYNFDFRDTIISTIVFFGLMFFVLNVHKNWDGPISVIQHNKMRFSETSSIYEDAFLQLFDFFSKEKTIVKYEQIDVNKFQRIFQDWDENRIPWYEQVCDLLCLGDYQYKIDIDNDYYVNEKCFISHYGKTKDNIAILCLLKYPELTEIDSFINFTKSLNLKFSKHIIAIKNFQGNIEIKKFGASDIIIRNEEEMLNSLVDFSHYEIFINELFKNKAISNSTNITLEDIYVPASGKSDNDVQIDRIEDFIHNWLLHDKTNKHLAILGEYGCGKSVLSLKITYDLLKNKSLNSRIPILIELRGKSPRNLNMSEILSIWASNFGINPASLMILHKAGKLLIIFEGFDEMDMVGDREMRLNHFQRLWEFAIPKSKIIITGRPNFFLDDKELKRNLGIYIPYNSSHHCEAIYLSKFNFDQIKLALRNVEKSTREQVIEILEKEKKSGFFDLISRPAILFLVALIWEERHLSEIKDQINSARVISEFIKYSYERQNDKNIAFPLTEKEREFFMIGIAIGMVKESGFSNQLYKNSLESIISKLYKFFPDEISANSTATQPRRLPLKQRMVDNLNAEETVLTDVRSCGILVNDLTRVNYFKFAHKSYLEYQSSLFFVECLLQDKKDYNLLVNFISTALEFSYKEIFHTDETIAFVSEILINKLNLSNGDDPKYLAQKLLFILYPYKLLAKFPFIYGVVNYFANRSLLFMTFGMITGFTGIIITHKISPANYMTLVGIILLVLNIIFVALRILTRNGNKRLMIWLKCCEQLQISSEIINSIIPEKFLKEGLNPKKDFIRKFILDTILK